MKDRGDSRREPRRERDRIGFLASPRLGAVALPESGRLKVEVKKFVNMVRAA